MASLIKNKNIVSAHDISEGGLAITLLESGFTSNLGFEVGAAPAGFRTDAYWFGEAQSRVVVSCGAEQVAAVEQAAAAAGVAFSVLGKVTSGVVNVGAENWGTITSWKHKYDTAIENLIK